MQQKIEINIGGIKYQLSRNICEKIPRVSEYINDNKYFIDRDGKLFGYLLHLVLEKDIDIDNISTNKMMLEKLNTEATWYGLKNISENILQYMEKVGHDISLIRFMDSVYDVANNEDNILDIEKLAGIRQNSDIDITEYLDNYNIDPTTIHYTNKYLSTTCHGKKML